MVNLNVTGEKIKKHNPNWQQILDHWYILSIIRGSWKTKTSLNLISHQPGIDKIYLFAKDPFEAKCQLLIIKRKIVSCNYSKAFTESWMIWMIFMKTLMIATQIKNAKYWLYLLISNLNPIVTELSIRGRKLNISFIFITQPLFTVPD